MGDLTSPKRRYVRRPVRGKALLGWFRTGAATYAHFACGHGTSVHRHFFDSSALPGHQARSTVMNSERFARPSPRFSETASRETQARKWSILHWTVKPRQRVTAPVPFTRRSARSLGVTRHALLTDARYEQLTRGVWVDTEPETTVITPTWAEHQWLRQHVRLSAYTCTDPEAVGCNVTAARLYGLPLPRSADKRVHVALSDLNATKRRRGLVLHRYAGLQSCDFFGLSLIAVPQLFAELAAVLTIEQLVTFGDAAVGRWHCGPLTTIDAIRAEVASRTRLIGRRTADRALDLMREDVDSPPETEVRLRLVAAGLPEPTVHPPVYCSTIDAVLRPDMGYPGVKVAIEYEGEHHRSSSEQFAEDNRRAAALEAEGWTIVKVSKDTDKAEFCHIVEQHLRRLGYV